MKRREFLRTAGGAAGATAAAGGAATPAAGRSGPAALQEDQTDTGEDGAGAGAQNESDAGEEGEEESGSDGPTETVIVGPDGELVFEPESITVAPGTTVVWEWDSAGHNVAPTSIPEGAEWEGHPEVVDDPNTYQHTFEVEGTYEYECTPHATAGMVGEVVVSEGGGGGGGGGGGHQEADPAHMGVPLQKHFIGAAAFMGIFATFVFTFYLLKYGESAHTSAPGKE